MGEHELPLCTLLQLATPEQWRPGEQGRPAVGVRSGRLGEASDQVDNR
jgi:hypothetical protein